MKKLLYFLLLVPTLLMAQNRPDWEYNINQPIGAFFPAYLPMTTSKYMVTQNTFYEYNWVSNNLQRLIEQYFNLKRSSDNVNKGTYIVDIYKTPAGRVIDNLKIKYNLFTMYGMYIVSSVEVTGSKAQVIKLFIYLYNNEIQSSDLKNGFIKTFAQDNAIYSQVNGISSIKISNVVYKNQDQFKIDFNNKKEKFKIDLKNEKIGNEQKRIEEEEFIKKRSMQFKADSIERKNENQAAYAEHQKKEAAKPKTAINVYYFSKSGDKLKFKNQPSAEVEKLINEKVSDYKKGNYSAYVTTTLIVENKTYDIKINQNQ